MTRQQDDDAPTTSHLPMLVALLIVAASAAFAVWTLRRTPLLFDRAEATPVTSPGPAMAATTTRMPLVAPERAVARPTRTAAPRTATPVATVVPARTATAIAATATATASPTPPPVVVAALSTATLPPPTAAPTAPAMPVLSHVSPPRVPRGHTLLFDVHGRDFRAEHLALVLRDGVRPAEVRVGRQKRIDSTKLQIVVAIGERAAKGAYDVVVIDGQGNRTNTVRFEVIR